MILFKKLRFVIVNFIIFFVVGFPIYELFQNEEFFPFSTYRMYSRLYTLDNIREAAILVTAKLDDGSEKPIRSLGSISAEKLQAYFFSKEINGAASAKMEGKISSLIAREKQKPGSTIQLLLEEPGKKVQSLIIYSLKFDSVENLRSKHPSSVEILTEWKLYQ